MNKKKLIIAIGLLILVMLAFLWSATAQTVSQVQITNSFLSQLTKNSVKSTASPVQQTVSVARVGNYYWAIGLKPWNSGPPAPEYAIYDLTGKMVSNALLKPDQVDHQNPFNLAYQAYYDLTNPPAQDMPGYFHGLSDLYGKKTTVDLVSQVNQQNKFIQPARYVQLLKPEVGNSSGNLVQIGFRCLMVQDKVGVIDERVVVQEQINQGKWEVTGVRMDRDKLNKVRQGDQPEWVTVLKAGF